MDNHLSITWCYAAPVAAQRVTWAIPKSVHTLAGCAELKSSHSCLGKNRCSALRSGAHSGIHELKSRCSAKSGVRCRSCQNASWSILTIAGLPRSRRFRSTSRLWGSRADHTHSNSLLSWSRLITCAHAQRLDMSREQSPPAVQNAASWSVLTSTGLSIPAAQSPRLRGTGEVHDPPLSSRSSWQLLRAGSRVRHARASFVGAGATKIAARRRLPTALPHAHALVQAHNSC